jgi:hypothetical protein
MVIDRQFAADGHVIHLAVEMTANGWDVEEKCDSALHVEHHHDWRHVEWAMRRLEREALRHEPGVSHN